MLPIDVSLVREKSLNKNNVFSVFFSEPLLYPPQVSLPYKNRVLDVASSEIERESHRNYKNGPGTKNWYCTISGCFRVGIYPSHRPYPYCLHRPFISSTFRHHSPKGFFRCFEWFPTIKDIYTDKPVEDRRMMQLLSRIRSMISVLPIPKGGVKQEPKSSP